MRKSVIHCFPENHFQGGFGHTQESVVRFIEKKETIHITKKSDTSLETRLPPLNENCKNFYNQKGNVRQKQRFRNSTVFQG